MFWWILAQNVDPNARSVFLGLPEQAQKAVVAMGDVNGEHFRARNPSAMLMSRIRQVHNAWVPLDDDTLAAKRTKIADDIIKPTICISIRGECERKGGRGQHDSIAGLWEFEENMESIRKHVLQPLLEQGIYQVHVRACIKAEGDTDEIEKIMRAKFGKSFSEARIQKGLFGRDQVGAVISSWDMFVHWKSQRLFLGQVIAVLFLRADVKFKETGTHLWPMTDKLCFLWNTKVGKQNSTVNDIIFSVPEPLFETFRDELANLKMPSSHLHWLSINKNLQPHVWVEFHIKHPSNTELSANPRYQITGRPESAGTFAELGKFKEAALRQRSDYNELLEDFSRKHGEHEALHASFAKKVKSLLFQFLVKPDSCELSVHDFKSCWYHLYPEYDLKWYVASTITKSMERLSFVNIRRDSIGAMFSFWDERQVASSSSSSSRMPAERGASAERVTILIDEPPSASNRPKRPSPGPKRMPIHARPLPIPSSMPIRPAAKSSSDALGPQLVNKTQQTAVPPPTVPRPTRIRPWHNNRPWARIDYGGV